MDDMKRKYGMGKLRAVRFTEYENKLISAFIRKMEAEKKKDISFSKMARDAIRDYMDKFKKAS